MPSSTMRAASLPPLSTLALILLVFVPCLLSIVPSSSSYGLIVGASAHAYDDVDPYEDAYEDFPIAEAARHHDDASYAFSHLDLEDDSDDEFAVEEGPGLFNRAVRFVGNNIQYILIASVVILGVNTYFLIFAMGYLLKEEHVIVRAARFKARKPEQVWKAIVDVMGYPAWRDDVGSVKIVKGKEQEAAVENGDVKVGFAHAEVSGMTTKGPYEVTEVIPKELLVRKTHPDYTPIQYAQPMVMQGAPVAANINSEMTKKAKLDAKEEAKKAREAKDADGKEMAGTDAAAPVKKSSASNVLNLPAAPLFYPPTVPASTETWTFELEPINGGKGCLLYITYQGTIRNRVRRFFHSLSGFDGRVEKFIGRLGLFLGENTGSIKPEMGRLNHSPELLRDGAAIHTTSVLVGEDAEEDSTLVATQKLANFVSSFRLDNVFIYRDQLQQNLLVKCYFLEVDLSHLTSFDEELANQLKERPSKMLPLFENAVKNVARQNNMLMGEEVPSCQVMLLLNTNPIPLRELDASYVGKLVRVHGIIIMASTLSAKATLVHAMCKNCRHGKTIMIESGFSGMQLPRTCDSEPDPQTGKQCPMDPFVVVPDRSKFVDMQVLKLQETPETVPVGELPRHILLTCDRSLTDKVDAGRRVAVTGIYSIYEAKNAKNAAKIALRSPYLRVVGIQRDRDGTRNRVFTEEEESEYIQMSRRPNLYEEFSQSIAPAIYGSEDIKKAISTLLFGGSKKVLPDGMKLRGDVNVLLLGDPGTAKSQLLKFVEKREFCLEAGAMVLADGGVVCIDEFDKMRDEDRVAIHEAMEQQTISIAKAGITTILNSRTSVLAAANPVFGRYDDQKTPGENVDFQSTILSRFDLIFIVRDEHNEERDQTIARHVLNVHMNLRAMDTVGEVSMQKMKGYISYCKAKCAPRLSIEAGDKLSSHFVEVRSRVRAFETKAAIPITIRQLEAIVRISESLAKMSLSPVATVEHVEEAIRLFNISTMSAVQSGQDNIGGMGASGNDITRAQIHIRTRLPIGSQLSLQAVRDDLLKHK
ncbi:minichromosome maintenance protein 5 [Irineochytrium annulatum]|nr:minichromosome maintenance protein 5 [Irineochytrium annulatum]